MADNDVKIPSSSLPEVEKILQGYAHAGSDMALEDLQRLLSINADIITRNNAFLVFAGLIDGGKKKRATDLGRRLGRALEHGMEAEVRRLWRETVSGNEYLSNLVSTVRLQKGMSEEDLTSHALYAGDLSDNRRNRTGATAVVDILKKAGVVEIRDGLIQVVQESDSTSAQQPVANAMTPAATPATPEAVNVPASTVAAGRLGGTGQPTININIQLQLPETENATVYETLFRSLRENLLYPGVTDRDE